MLGCPYMDSLPLIIEVGIFMDVFHFWEGIIFLLKREQNISFQMLWIDGVIAIAWICTFIFNNSIDQILDFHQRKAVFFIVDNEPVFHGLIVCVLPYFSPDDTL